MEDRVVDLEDALDELKAEFEAMMGDKKDDDKEEKEDESLEVAPELTPEVEMEGKQTEAMHKDKGMKKEAMHKDKKIWMSTKSRKVQTMPTIRTAKVHQLQAKVVQKWVALQ